MAPVSLVKPTSLGLEPGLVLELGSGLVFGLDFGTKKPRKENKLRKINLNFMILYYTNE